MEGGGEPRGRGDTEPLAGGVGGEPWGDTQTSWHVVEGKQAAHRAPTRRAGGGELQGVPEIEGDGSGGMQGDIGLYAMSSAAGSSAGCSPLVVSSAP